MAETVNQVWARALIEELVRSGLHHAVIAPGSRSTPLALACATQPGLQTWSVLDERSAAFFALGIAKQSGVPALVLATSGTAGAHFYPAVIEAAMSHVPLIVITADRPAELQGWGAPQTIPQASLFGAFPRAFFDVALPEASDPALLHLRANACLAYSRTVTAPRGPVHLNVPFREPLVPPPQPPALPALPTRALVGDDDRPLVRLRASTAEVVPLALDAVRAELEKTERGLIVVGPRDAADGLAEAVMVLGHAWGYPVLAEAASNARFGHAEDVVAMYDALLRHPPFASAHTPEVVLRFGGGLTPKAPGQWLDASGARTYVFSDTGALVDPAHTATSVLTGDPVRACQALIAAAKGRSSAWRADFLGAERRARAALRAAYAEDGPLDEPRVAFELAQLLPAAARLFVSSSMPIRDLDAFAIAGERFRVFANRGANGIDGITSSALGVAAASGQPTVLYTGDVAFLHDLGGLLLARRHGLRLTIVVVNNDGGGIFSFLPIAGRTPHFEALFGTPHGVDLAHAAALCGARHVRCEDASQLRAAVKQGLEGGLNVIEVRTDRAANVKAHQALFARIGAALGDGPWA